MHVRGNLCLYHELMVISGMVKFCNRNFHSTVTL